jgi:uncharacterized protein YndB with AHSA1/START domain
MPEGERSMTLSRQFAAPPEVVFRVFTEAEHLRHWWGPRMLENVVCEADVRPGGAWRVVQRTPDGTEHEFSGVHREVDPPRRVVRTWIWHGMPDDVAVETVTFEAIEGGTLVRSTAEHATVEARDQHIANGMEGGMRESFERLDEYLPRV